MPPTSPISLLPHPLPIPKAMTRRTVILAFLALILLRSRTISLPKDAIGILRNAIASLSTFGARRDKVDPEELDRVLQQIYIDEPDGSKTLLVPYRERIVKVSIHETPKTQFDADRRYFPLLDSTVSVKPNINLAFLSQLRSILFRVAIPSWKSSESGLVALHSGFLVLRTVLSIMVARLDGLIVRDIVKADGKGFLRGLGLWFLLAIPSTITNSMIRHLQSLLTLRLRTRLTRYLHDLYLSSDPDLRYYRVSNYLDGVDQYLTSDVEAWANAFSGIYGNLLKPSLDLILFTSQLSRSLGFRGTLLMFVNYYCTVTILRAVTPAFGRLAAIEARLEGEYRAGMARVGREAEEVAFYDGGAREHNILTKLYLRLIKHVNSIYRIRIAYEWTEDYVIKYLWSAFGYVLIAIPILLRRKRRLSTKIASRDRDEAVAGRTEAYISNRRLLLNLADAGGRWMYAYKDLVELAGLTSRLYTLLSTLLNLPKGYEPINVEQGNVIRFDGVDVGIPRVSKVKEGDEKKLVDKFSTQKNGGAEGRRDDRDAPLVKDLNLVIERGDHTMITGINGVGKTAVARVLAGLWDPVSSDGEGGGQVEMPKDDAETKAFFLGKVRPESSRPHKKPRPTVYVLPQRAYMPVGSLLEQIIYPCSYATFVKITCSPTDLPRRTSSFLSLPSLSGTSSAADVLATTPSPSHEAIREIHEILEKVHLGYLIAREGGLHVRKEWRDVLSGGEKQRMGIARVLWWRPKWAVLDECTSAISSDVEGRLYEALKAMDITLVTISLRPSLAKYHRQMLTLHGPTGSSPGRWMLARVGTPEERLSVQHEIKALEDKLKEVDGWETRVKELEVLLSVQEDLDDVQS